VAIKLNPRRGEASERKNDQQFYGSAFRDPLAYWCWVSLLLYDVVYLDGEHDAGRPRRMHT